MPKVASSTQEFVMVLYVCFLCCCSGFTFPVQKPLLCHVIVQFICDVISFSVPKHIAEWSGVEWSGNNTLVKTIVLRRFCGLELYLLTGFGYVFSNADRYCTNSYNVTRL